MTTGTQIMALQWLATLAMSTEGFRIEPFEIIHTDKQTI